MEHGTVSISCDECSVGPGPCCEDCVVSFVLGYEGHEGLVVDAAEARALRLLAGAGLVPPVRHRCAAAG
jgi:hypothetical protein